MGFLDKQRDKQTAAFLEEISSHLLAGESVTEMSLGVAVHRNDKTYNGSLALTEGRLIFIGKSVTERLIDTHPLRTTTGVTTTHGAVVGELVIQNGLTITEFKMPRKTMDAFAAAVRRVAESQVVDAPAPAPTSAPSVADELVKLADLHKQGILTDDEFAAAKARLIG